MPNTLRRLLDPSSPEPTRLRDIAAQPAYAGWVTKRVMTSVGGGFFRFFQSSSSNSEGSTRTRWKRRWAAIVGHQIIFFKSDKPNEILLSAVDLTMFVYAIHDPSASSESRNCIRISHTRPSATTGDDQSVASAGSSNSVRSFAKSFMSSMKPQNAGCGSTSASAQSPSDRKLLARRSMQTVDPQRGQQQQQQKQSAEQQKLESFPDLVFFPDSSIAVKQWLSVILPRLGLVPATPSAQSPSFSLPSVDLGEENAVDRALRGMDVASYNRQRLARQATVSPQQQHSQQQALRFDSPYGTAIGAAAKSSQTSTILENSDSASLLSNRSSTLMANTENAGPDSSSGSMVSASSNRVGLMSGSTLPSISGYISSAIQRVPAAVPSSPDYDSQYGGYFPSLAAMAVNPPGVMRAHSLSPAMPSLSEGTGTPPQGSSTPGSAASTPSSDYRALPFTNTSAVPNVLPHPVLSPLMNSSLAAGNVVKRVGSGSLPYGMLQQQQQQQQQQRLYAGDDNAIASASLGKRSLYPGYGNADNSVPQPPFPGMSAELLQPSYTPASPKLEPTRSMDAPASKRRASFLRSVNNASAELTKSLAETTLASPKTAYPADGAYQQPAPHPLSPQLQYQQHGALYTGRRMSFVEVPPAAQLSRPVSTASSTEQNFNMASQPTRIEKAASVLSRESGSSGGSGLRPRRVRPRGSSSVNEQGGEGDGSLRPAGLHKSSSYSAAFSSMTSLDQMPPLPSMPPHSPFVNTTPANRMNPTH